MYIYMRQLKITHELVKTYNSQFMAKRKKSETVVMLRKGVLGSKENRRI